MTTAKPSASAINENRLQFDRIRTLVRPYIGRLALCLALIMGATALQLSLPLGIKYIFDQMLESRQAKVIHLVTLGLLLVFVVRSFMGFLGQFLVQVLSDRIIIDLRIQLFRHLHELELQFHHGQRVGDILSRMSSDVGAIRNVVANLGISMIISVFQLIGASALMLAMNWKLALVVLAVGPVTTLIARGFSPIFTALSEKIQGELAKSSVIAHESLSGIEVTKTFGRREYESGRYRDGLFSYMAMLVRARKMDAFFNALVAFATSSSTIAIFWFGGLQVMAGALTAGTLVAFLLYSQSITQSIGSLAQHYTSFVQALGASRRVFEILETRPRLAERADATALELPIHRVEVDRVDFAYRPGLPVLRDVSLSAGVGETIALVGQSGSGKSTLLKLICRLYDPDRGAVRINGRDIRHYTLTSLLNAIAMVSQDVFLFGSSVRENIRYGRLDASDDEVEAAARAANAHEFIHMLPEGYDTQVGERGVQLSGGQRQRVSIARALLKDAPILLLDEATSSVDAASEKLIQQAIERVKHNRTTLVIAHRLETVRNADQILVLSAGEVVDRPSFEMLIANQERYVHLLQEEEHALLQARAASQDRRGERIS